jgi:hypothetical protein
MAPPQIPQQIATRQQTDDTGRGDINVVVEFNDCKFDGEDTADVVENTVADRLRNREGVIYKEIRRMKSNGTQTGVRKR